MNISHFILARLQFRVHVAIDGVITPLSRWRGVGGEAILFIAEEVEFQLTIDFVYHLLLAFAGIWV